MSSAYIGEYINMVGWDIVLYSHVILCVIMIRDIVLYMNVVQCVL